MLISPAYAQAAGGASQGDTLLTFLPMIAIFVVFYFLLIRPQQKRSKEHKALLGALKKGDEVVTSGGIYGRVAAITDDVVTLEVAPNIKIRIQRQSIGTVKKSSG